MATYIVRRLLLAIPTLVGITLLVFLLVALSPGGISGVESGSGMGELHSGAVAQQAERLDQRYGLDAPVLIQYLRWLGRVSPIRFGAREQVRSNGEVVRPARDVRDPPLLHWWEGALSDAPSPPSVADAGDAAEERQRAFDASHARQYRARVEYRERLLALDAALLRYATAAGIEGAADAHRRPRAEVIGRTAPRRDLAEWVQVQEAGAAAAESCSKVRRATAESVARFKTRPYPQAGIGLIPGVLWVTWPDLGVSVSGRRVTSLVADALPVTLLLNLVAFPIIYLVAIPCGVLAAARKGSWLDVGLGGVFVALWSIPTVWASVLAIGYLASPQYLGWFPASGLNDRSADSFTFLPRWGDGAFERGYLLDLGWHLCLPVACLVYGGFAVLSRQTRAAMLENLSADYVRTARAKGVPRGAVLLRHVGRNSLLPLITMFAGLFPALLGGSVVVERVFSIPGMGTLMLTAISERDREVILAVTLMIALVSMLALLLADILYAAADPRVEFEET
jgi:peptide/nickel transport system permease protein